MFNCTVTETNLETVKGLSNKIRQIITAFPGSECRLLASQMKQICTLAAAIKVIADDTSYDSHSK